MYSMKVNEEEYLAGMARIEEVDASFKDLGAVCDNIRYKNARAAIELLEKAAKGEVPLRYYKHNKKLGHRKELQGQKGRYPKKAAKIVLSVLKNAVANALHKGASEDSLVVKHAAANKKRTYYRVQPKGRRLRHDYELARVEVIVVQKMSEELKKKVAEAKQKAKEEAKAKQEAAKPAKEEAKEQTKQAAKQQKKTAAKKTEKPETEKPAKKPAVKKAAPKKTEKAKKGSSEGGEN